MLILVRTILYFGEILSTALLIRALLSWFARSSSLLSKIYEVLYKFTEPLVAPVRNLMSRYFNTGMFDFSIFVTMILIEVVTRILARLLLFFV